MTFENQMKAFVELTGKAAMDSFRGTCIDISSSIIDMTPMDSGRAKNNWFPNINMFTSGTTEEVDKNGDKAKAKASSVASTIKMGQTFTLTNNLDYIERLEYGWSSQARGPDGMVRQTLLRFDQILKRNVT
jgi:hypothetical protein